MWAVDAAGVPRLAAAVHLPESIAALSGGHVTSASSPDIIVHTGLTGRVRCPSHNDTFCCCAFTLPAYTAIRFCLPTPLSCRSSHSQLIQQHLRSVLSSQTLSVLPVPWAPSQASIVQHSTHVKLLLEVQQGTRQTCLRCSTQELHVRRKSSRSCMHASPESVRGGMYICCAIAASVIALSFDCTCAAIPFFRIALLNTPLCQMCCPWPGWRVICGTARGRAPLADAPGTGWLSYAVGGGSSVTVCTRIARAWRV